MNAITECYIGEYADYVSLNINPVTGEITSNLEPKLAIQLAHTIFPEWIMEAVSCKLHSQS